MSTEFLNAALAEQQSLDVESIMEALLQQTKEEGELKERPDDMKLRDFLFVIDRLERERDELKENKKLVIERWDSMIQKKTDNIEGLRGIVLQEMLLRKEENPKKGKLTLDIGTISTSVKKGVLVPVDDFALEMKARETGDISKHIVPAKFNAKSLLKEINDSFKESEVVPEAYAGIVSLSEESSSLLIRSKIKK